MKRIFGYVLFGMVFIFMLMTSIFYRKDIDYQELKQKYEKEESRWSHIVIDDLNQSSLSIDIHYLDFGDPQAPTIVLLHGMFSSAFTFIPWADQLVEAGYRVIAIDLPYHGLSGGFTDQKTSLIRSAHVVHKLLQQIDVTSFVIGGNSMGGGVSFVYASEFKEDVNILGLILIDSVYQTQEQRNRPIQHRVIIDYISKLTPKFTLRYLLSGAYGSESILTHDTLDRYSDFIRKEGYRTNLLMLRNEQDSSLLSLQNRILSIREDQIETLILWGKQDKWIPLEIGLSIKRDLNLPDNRMVIFDQLGHVPMEENPNLTIIDVLNFLKEVLN